MRLAALLLTPPQIFLLVSSDSYRIIV